MLSFDSLAEFGGWVETAREKFLNAKQIKEVESITVEERHNKETGEPFLAMCFLMRSGKKRSHYLSKLSELTDGDEVDPKSVEVIELDNGVDDPIYRLDGKSR